MDVGTGDRGSSETRETASVNIELRGALVARAGVRQGRVVVPDGSTVAEAVEQWAEESGTQLRVALLDGDHFAADVLAERISRGRAERLAASEHVSDEDTLTFEFCD